MIRIIPGEFDDPRVIELLHFHLTHARAQTAPGSAHALDLTGLQTPDISFWTAWLDDTLVGMGALKMLSQEHGEIKSMHTLQTARRTGVGSALLRHLVSIAREKGLTRLSLETGSWDYFLPAQELYRRHGFVDCGPFGNYKLDPNSVFMTLDLRT